MGRFLNCDKPPQFVVYLKEHRDEIMNRFTMKTDENGTPRLYDNETQCSYPIDDSPDNVEILINRLNDLDTFRMGYFGLEKTVKQLKDENHRLRLTMCHLNDLNIDIEWLKEHLGEWEK